MALVNEAPRRPREPAWHRRLRRERSGFRILARVAAACVSLERHHGSHPPEILRPLLLAVRHPLPSEVPWPRFSEKGALRNPKPESPPLVPVTMVGDFRSLPGDYWRTISTRSSWKYHIVSSPTSPTSLVLDEELRALAVQRVLALVTPLVASVHSVWTSPAMIAQVIAQVNASPDLARKIDSLLNSIDAVVSAIPSEALSWNTLLDVSMFIERFTLLIEPSLSSSHAPGA
jgi:hypothetical protein